MHDRVGAAEPALGRAPLVLLQALRELDRQVNLGTEKQWSCGDAIVTSGHLLGKHFPKMQRSYSNCQEFARCARLLLIGLCLSGYTGLNDLRRA